jgi:cobalt-zinc-cadmium efflux system protein
MSTTETALTAHVVTPAGFPGDAFTADLARQLKERFAIDHPTIQIETGAAVDCALEPADVV